jgi:hypothetical protein
VNSTPHSSVAATGHFVEAERLVEALPLAGKRGEWDPGRGSPRSTRYSPSRRAYSTSRRRDAGALRNAESRRDSFLPLDYRAGVGP